MIDMWLIYIISIVIVILVFLIYIVLKWIKIYNKFQELKTEVENQYANLKIIIQQRIVMMPELAKVAKKYSEHEYSTFTDVTKARSGLSTGDINSRINIAQKIENNWIKLQAIFEKYPELKANEIYQRLMGDEDVSKIENRFRNAAEKYNEHVKKYNFSIRRFPQSIVAKIHHLQLIDHFTFPDVEYGPQEFFD